MQRLFTFFPAGTPGLALLCLRVMIGTAAIAAGVVYLEAWHSSGWPARLVAPAAIGDGALLVLGFLTPFAGAITPLLACALAFQWLLPPTAWSADIRLVTLPACVVSLALVALGPGAYSVDARLFGRKQLLIPPPRPRHED